MSRPSDSDPLHLTEAEYGEMLEFSEGLCLSCGTHTGTIDPDGRGLPCPVCHRHEVYGIEVLMLRGIVIVVEARDATS